MAGHDGREYIDVKELELVIRKFGRIGQECCLIYHPLPMYYASVAFALRKNNDLLYSTSK